MKSALRWLAVFPAFILAGLGIAALMLIVTFVSDWILHWIPFFDDTPTFDEAVAFFSAKDMHHMYWFGTLWHITAWGFAWCGGITAAINTAPSHKLFVGRVMIWFTIAACILAFALQMYLFPPVGFSWWYRHVLADVTMLYGEWFGLMCKRREIGERVQ